MVESRCLDERLVLLLRRGDGYFWTGGPGEEAFNSTLGSFLKTGHGPDHDFLLPHYRSSAVALMAGLKSIDFLRQMTGRATDPFSYGRNFANHFCDATRNLGPVSSPVTSQFLFALGTARAQRRRRGITVTIGGEASTQSGDFATLLTWATRPGDPLPVLIVVTHNGIGISTRYRDQCAVSPTDRARAFGIAAERVDGLSVDDSYAVLDEAFRHVRGDRLPFLVEAKVSRLWGHSSSSGATRDVSEEDPLDRVRVPSAWRKAIERRLQEEGRQVLDEPPVSSESAEEHVWGAEGASWPRLHRR